MKALTTSHRAFFSGDWSVWAIVVVECVGGASFLLFSLYVFADLGELILSRPYRLFDGFVVAVVGVETPK